MGFLYISISESDPNAWIIKSTEHYQLNIIETSIFGVNSVHLHVIQYTDVYNGNISTHVSLKSIQTFLQLILAKIILISHLRMISELKCYFFL